MTRWLTPSIVCCFLLRARAAKGSRVRGVFHWWKFTGDGPRLRVSQASKASWCKSSFSAFGRLLERLLQHKLHHVGLHRERCYCYNLARILLGGELFEHTVCQICPGGKLSSYVIFSHLVVSDG